MQLMLHLKFYKPLIGLLLKNINLKNRIDYKASKTRQLKVKLNKLSLKILIWSDRVCFHTLKYKTQLNVLKQSRFYLRHCLTFNKDHTWIKYTH